MYKPNFSKIHHIAIIGSDYKKSRHFYVDILGFLVIRETNLPEKKDVKIDLQMNESSEIELFIKKDTPSRLSYPEARGLRHLAIQTHHIEEDMVYLKSKGVRVEELRIDEITNKKMVFFYDPDELPIELHE